MRKFLAVPTLGLSLRGGKDTGDGGSKAERRADDLATQAHRDIQQATTFMPEELARRAETFALERSQTPFLEARARASPEDLFGQTGPAAQALRQRITDAFGLSPEQLFDQGGPAARALRQHIEQQFGMAPEDLFGGISPQARSVQDLVTQRLASPPQIPFEDTFKQNLALVQDAVNAQAARRGITTGSGLSLEHLGRAGIDLAIRQAQAHAEQARLNEQLRQDTIAQALGLVGSQEQLAQQAFGRESGLVEQERGLSEQAFGREAGLVQESERLGEGARSELERHLQRLQGLSQQDRFRQAQGAVQAQAAAQPFELTGLAALNQREEQARQRNQMIEKALGSAALGAVTGGLGFLPAAGGGLMPGGFSAAMQGGLQSALGIGAFDPYAGVHGMLEQLRSQNVRGAGTPLPDNFFLRNFLQQPSGGR